MKSKAKNPEKLEDMSNEELLALQDGFLKLLCHANRGIENIGIYLEDNTHFCLSFRNMLELSPIAL